MSSTPLLSLYNEMIDCSRLAEIRRSGMMINLSPLKAPIKNCSRRHFNYLLLSFEENKA